eukprot:TRINITY_DN911_c1_g2_i1.p1 TRINITY_DN911_c1_g2~~TRINITY_DN911_c1_g2_i1.p1  ORF type:complete len:170 (+),score=34.98 TRINITY_DN911_c1_g2_i1:36-512(+)
MRYLIQFLTVSLCLVLVVHGESSPLEELEVKTIKEGRNCDKQTAQPGDVLHVHYTGRLNDENGKIFDSSKDRGMTYNFQLGAGQVIRGYEEGVPGMCLKEVRTLRVPPALAYGQTGVPSAGIPPNAVLHFTVELMKIIKDRPMTLPPGLSIPGVKNEL